MTDKPAQEITISGVETGDSELTAALVVIAALRTLPDYTARARVLRYVHTRLEESYFRHENTVAKTVPASGVLGLPGAIDKI